MTYTYLSAQYANSENTAAVAITEESSAVLLSLTDNPAEWQAMHDAVEVEAYVAPPPAPAPTKAELVQKLHELQEQISSLEF